MKYLEKLGFIYSLIAVSVVAITLAVWSPSVYSIIDTLVLIPIVVFFWLRLTSPEDVSLPKWSIRVVIVIGVLLIASTYAMFVPRIFFGNTDNKEEIELAANIDELKEEISKLQNSEGDMDALMAELSEIKESLSGSDSEYIDTSKSEIANLIDGGDGDGFTLGQITPSNSFVEEVNVFTEADLSSDVAGTIVYGSSYFYYEQNGSWYKIMLPDSEVYGWVHEKDVEEK